MTSLTKTARTKPITLLPHQDEGIEKYKDSDAMLFYHGLGSGKTISSIAATLGKDDVDVVVPAPLRENFKKELGKFDIKNKYHIRSFQHFTKHGPKDKIQTIIVDEPQKIGRTSSAISQAMVNAAPTYKRRLMLSGTPASNNPAELAPIIRFLNPDAHEIPLNPTEFNDKFVDKKVIPVGFIHKLLGYGPGIEEAIKNRPILERAIKGRVHYHEPSRKHFPQRDDHIVQVEASPEQDKYYKFVTSQANPVIAYKIKNNLPLSKKDLKDINAFMTAARQVSNSTTPYGGHEEYSPKMRSVIDNVKNSIAEDPEHKGLIYSNYLGAGVLPISKKLDYEGIKHRVFTGSMNDKEKKAVVDEYNKGKINALLITGSGAEGIDLKGTSSIHILEPHWNKNKIEQVIGRGIRYKSHEGLPEEKRKVDVYKYQTIVPKTFIQKIFGLQRGTSTDQALENLSEKKQLLLNQFLDVLKTEGSSPLVKESCYRNFIQSIYKSAYNSELEKLLHN